MDVKELFSPQRHRLLRGEPPLEATELAVHSGTWRAFPDPAVRAQLLGKTTQAMEMLQSCGSRWNQVVKGWGRISGDFRDHGPPTRWTQQLFPDSRCFGVYFLI